LDDNGLIVTR